MEKTHIPLDFMMDYMEEGVKSEKTKPNYFGYISLFCWVRIKHDKE